MLSVAFVAMMLVARNSGQKDLVEKRMKAFPVVVFSVISVMLTDVLASGGSVSLYSLAMEILPSVWAVWLISSSLLETDITKWTLRIVLLLNIAAMVFNVCRMAGIADGIPDELNIKVLSFSLVVFLTVSICGYAGMMRDVKSIMTNGAVWAVVCLTVDVTYLCFIIFAVALVQMDSPAMGIMQLCTVMCAVGIRIRTDSKFVIWQKQERLIVESMRVTSVSSAVDASRIDDIYKDLYERIVAYFETEKPFLDNELTINMLVKGMYSNKLYISRAISQFTGRNFCQFVNYYRVMHSMESFRGNPELKVHELATMSGFNSVVSYNMAFRLFMGENPSEWCRKEKSRIIKAKK